MRRPVRRAGRKVDEAYFGRQGAKHARQEASVRGVRGTAGKTASLLGVKDRETNRISVSGVRLIRGASVRCTASLPSALSQLGATIYSDEHSELRAACRITTRRSITPSASIVSAARRIRERHGETSGPLMKRGYYGTFHQDEPEAPGPLRARVRRAPQHPPGRHPRPDERCRSEHEREAATLPRTHRPRRTRFGGAIKVG